MVFSEEDKAIIKNDFEEKGFTAYKIWKEHKYKGWVLSSVQRLLNRYKENGTMKRKEGSGRPVTATTDGNADIVENLICSQEESPGTHKSPHDIARHIGICRTSIRRLIKRKNFRQFKRVKTSQINNGTKNRRRTRTGDLASRFKRNARLIEKCA